MKRTACNVAVALAFGTHPGLEWAFPWVRVQYRGSKGNVFWKFHLVGEPETYGRRS